MFIDGSYEKQQDMRFMIDNSTYKRLNPDSQVAKMQLKDELGADAMASVEPPSLMFIQFLPSHLWGFSLQDKKWSILAQPSWYPHHSETC